MNDSGVYIISIAARMVEMHPQTLRKYERAGFLEPTRTDGNLRLYSAEDIERLQQIKQLVDERGVNLAGVELALALTRHVRHIESVLDGDSLPPEARETIARTIASMRNHLGVSPKPAPAGGIHGESHRH